MERLIEPEDIPARLPDWIRDHMHRYVTTAGEDGHIWRGVPTLLLETIGRRSNRPQVTPLIYGRDGDDYVVIASKGGAPAHPAWYLNLRDRPEGRIQVADSIMKVRSSVATGERRAAIWEAMVAIWPQYEDYRQKTDREIPVVCLTPLP